MEMLYEDKTDNENFMIEEDFDEGKSVG